MLEQANLWCFDLEVEIIWMGEATASLKPVTESEAKERVSTADPEWFGSTRE